MGIRIVSLNSTSQLGVPLKDFKTISLQGRHMPYQSLSDHVNRSCYLMLFTTILMGFYFSIFLGVAIHRVCFEICLHPSFSFMALVRHFVTFSQG